MKVDKAVRPYKGVEVSGGFTKYSVRAAKKVGEDKWETVGYISVMVKGGTPIPEKNPDKQTLTVTKITGVDLDKYNEKLSVTVWAEGYVDGAAKDNGFQQIKDEEIPF